jgi:predicted ester cyclase
MSEALKSRILEVTNPVSREGGVDVYGIADTRQAIAAMRAAFPNIRFTNDDMIVDKDRVVARWICTGTHRGEFRGIAPTGKRLKFMGINIFRMCDGKISER